MSVPLSDTHLAAYRDLSFLDGAITHFDQTAAAVAATRVLVREIDRLRAELAHAEAERNCFAMAIMFARGGSGWSTPWELSRGIDEILATGPAALSAPPAPTCGVLNPKVAATCTEPNDHSSPIHRDAFGNTWTRREGERPLSIPTA